MSTIFTWVHEGPPSPPVVVVSGEVDLLSCREAPVLLSAAPRRGPGPVVLDTSGVTFLDAAGLSVLLVLAARLGAAGHQVSLRRPSPAVVRLLALTGTAELLPVEAPGPEEGWGPPTAELLALQRSRSFRRVEQLVHDSTVRGDPRAAAGGIPRPAART